MNRRQFLECGAGLISVTALGGFSAASTQNINISRLGVSNLNDWESANGIDKKWIGQQLGMVVENQQLYSKMTAGSGFGDANPIEIESSILFGQRAPELVRRMFSLYDFPLWHLISVRTMESPCVELKWKDGDGTLAERASVCKTKKYKHHHSIGHPNVTIEDAEDILLSEIGREIEREVFADITHNHGTRANRNINEIDSAVPMMLRVMTEKNKCRPNWLVAGPEMIEKLKHEFYCIPVIHPHSNCNLMPIFDCILKCLDCDLLVVSDPLHKMNQILIGTKYAGEQGPGYFYGLYVPLVTCPIIRSEDFCPRSYGVLSRGCKTLWGKGAFNSYGKIEFDGMVLI